ncbi:hypothetical protein AOL_s00212g2, partial [Orbilia oligospora ATCC 24927]
MSRKFAIENDFPLYPKKIPESVEYFNGTRESVKEMTQFKMKIQDHEEIVNADIVNTTKPLNLGKPWHKKHKVHVDWENNQVHMNCSPKITIVSAEAFKRTMKQGPVFAIYGLGRKWKQVTFVDDTIEIEETTKLPNEFQDLAEAFSKKKGDTLPPRRKEDMKIPIPPEAQPIWEPLRPMSEEHLKVLKPWIEENMTKGFIRRSNSPWGAPILFVPKKDGGLRLCVDWRKLNAITVKDRCPLPRIDETLDRLRKAKHFTRLDIYGAYNRIRIADGDEEKTAFRTRYGHFEFQVVHFGLTNAPAAFQAYINEALRPFLDEFCVVYLDDICIYSDSREEHIRHVRKVIKALQKAGLYIKLSKCEFFTKETEFLGYIVGSNGIRMDPAKIQDILDWEEPKEGPGAVKEVQSFLGFANFYRRFIKDYAKIAKPLYDLTKKDRIFHWGKEEKNAFQTLQRAFCTEPILKHWNPALETRMETDASNFVCAAVLSQKHDDGLWHPVAYRSKKMTPAEHNYDIHDKELLSVIQAFKEWERYLMSVHTQVHILTDHKNLEYFMTKQHLRQRQVGWMEFLSRFDFKITFVPGKTNTKADALTRRSRDLPQGEEDERIKNRIRILLPPEKIQQIGIMTTQETWQAAALEDSYIQDIIKTLRRGDKRHPKVEISEMKEEQGELYHNDRKVVPDNEKIREEILQQHHDHPTAGHPGRAKTLELVQRQYTWVGLRKDVDRYVDNCHICKRTKAPRNAPQGLLQSLQIAERNWQSISFDLITGLPESNGHDAILVTVDRLSKMIHLTPTTKKLNARELAGLFLRDIWKLHGLPKEAISDRGKNFLDEFWDEVNNRLRIHHRPSTAYHPQTDGQTERINSIVEQYLRAYVNYQQDDWVEWLPLAEYSYNNKISDTTGISPFAANYGWNPDTFEFQGLRKPSRNQEAAGFVQQMSELQEVLRMEINRAAQIQQEQANKRRRPSPDYKEGDHVWLDMRNIKTARPCPKLSNKMEGPFQILKSVGKRAYKLKLPPSMRIHPVFHTNLLHPAPDNAFPSQNHEERLPPVTVDNEEEYEVEKILDSRIHYRKLQNYSTTFINPILIDPVPPPDILDPTSLFQYNPEEISEPIRVLQYPDVTQNLFSASDLLDIQTPEPIYISLYNEIWRLQTELAQAQKAMGNFSSTIENSPEQVTSDQIPNPEEEVQPKNPRSESPEIPEPEIPEIPEKNQEESFEKPLKTPEKPEFPGTKRKSSYRGFMPPKISKRYRRSKGPTMILDLRTEHRRD